MMTTKKSGILLISPLLFAALVFIGCAMDGGVEDRAMERSGEAGRYRVILDAFTHGSLQVNPPAALGGGVESGTTITLTVQPDPGYQLITDSLRVTGNAELVALTPAGADAYTFPITNDVQVSAFFKPQTTIAIGSAEELAKIGVDELYPLDANYYLTANLDLAAFNPWTPVGTSAVSSNPDDYNVTRREFTGAFDGRGHTVENLRLDGEAPYSGLFGYARLASIKNLTIKLAAEQSITLSETSRHYIGGAAGFVHGTEIADVTVENNLAISGGNALYAGKVIGYALNSALGNLGSEGDLNISVEATVYAGGLIGYARYSPLAGGSSSGAVTVSNANSTSYAGGFIGYAESSAINGGTPATGSLTVTGLSSAYGGGIVGYANRSSISGVSSEKNVSVTIDNTSGSAYGGGIAGYITSQSDPVVYAYTGSPISKSSSSGNVSVSITATDGVSYGSSGYAGGIVGQSNSNVDYDCIADCYATGAVTLETTGSNSYAGGIVGSGAGSITRSYATGAVRNIHNPGYTYAPTVYAGGLAGQSSSGGVFESYASGTVTAEYTGSVTGSNVLAGGLIGQTGVVTADSYATGTVTATGPNVRAGGLVGYLYSAGTVRRCYALGAVNGITDNVTVANNGVGGIAGAGFTNATIEYCAALSPSATISADSVNVKRVVGNSLSRLTNNFALEDMSLGEDDLAIDDNADSADGASKTGDELESATTYSDAVDDGGLGWDFPSVWKWDTVKTRPVLAWQ